MKIKLIFCLFVLANIDILGQIDRNLVLKDLFKKSLTIEIEYLQRLISEADDKTLDSVMLSNGLESELEKSKSNDTSQYYTYKLDFALMDDSKIRIKMYDFNLKADMSNIDVLNELHKSYFSQLEFKAILNKDLQIEKVDNKKSLIKTSKYFKKKEQYIINNSWNFSNNNYTTYQTLQMPISHEEINSFFILHFLPFIKYQQDLTQKMIFPYELNFFNSKEPYQDTLYTKVLEQDDNYMITNTLNTTEEELKQYIDYNTDKLNTSNPFNYHLAETIFLDKRDYMILKYTISTHSFDKQNSFKTIISYKITNGGYSAYKK